MPTDSIGLLEGISTTRAIRRYRDEPVPTDALATMLFAATRAPSGSNRQPFRFVVLRDGPHAREAKQLIGESARRIWGGKRTADGYDRGSGVEESSPKARMARTMQHYVDHFEDAPVLVLPCLVRYREPTPTEGASIYPACQNLLLAAPRARLRRSPHRLPRVRRARTPRAARDPRRRLHGRDHHDRPSRGRPRAGATPADRRARLRGIVGDSSGVGGRPAGHTPHLGRSTQGVNRPPTTGDRWTASTT